MVLDPIPQSLPVHFFGSRPQPPTSQIRTTRLSRRRLWHCYVSFGGIGDAIWAKYAASTPIIRVLSKKERKIQTTRLSRRRLWHCYVWFKDVGDAIWGRYTARKPIIRVLPRKEKKIQMMRLSRRLRVVWGCWWHNLSKVSFGDARQTRL